MNNQPNTKNHNYLKQNIYIPKEKRAFIKDKLGRDAEGKEFVDALVEKLSTV